METEPSTLLEALLHECNQEAAEAHCVPSDRSTPLPPEPAVPPSPPEWDPAPPCHPCQACQSQLTACQDLSVQMPQSPVHIREAASVVTAMWYLAWLANRTTASAQEAAGKTERCSAAVACLHAAGSAEHARLPYGLFTLVMLTAGAVLRGAG